MMFVIDQLKSRRKKFSYANYAEDWLILGMDLMKSPLGRFRILAFMEGVSFLAILFITMPLKYLYDMPTPNLVIGMAHGVLFMMYIGAVLYLRNKLDWKPKLTLQALAASVIPFGTFYMDRKVFTKL